MAKAFLGAPSIVAGIEVCPYRIKAVTVQSDATIFDVADQQVKDGYKFILLQSLGKIS